MDVTRRFLLGLALTLLGLSPGLGAAALAHSHPQSPAICGALDVGTEPCAGLMATRSEAPCPVCQALNGLQRLAGPAPGFEPAGANLARGVAPKPWLRTSEGVGRGHGARAPPLPA